MKYDLEFEVDPLFKSMTAKFNDNGARGLLLNNLPLDSNMDILFESKATMAENSLFNRKNQKEYSTDLTEGVKSIIDGTLLQFSLNDIKSLGICPDLSYFKKSRELETSLEKTFYQNFMSEFDDTMYKDNIMLDNSNNMLNDSFNSSINIADNIENDHISSVSQRTGSIESGMSPNFDAENLIHMGNEANRATFNNLIGLTYMEGISYLKGEEIKEYIHQFGDGNREMLKNLPQFKNFSKGFEKLDNKLNPLNMIHLNVKDNKEKRIKRDEKLFDFSADAVVERSEIFEKESKLKKQLRENKDFNKKDKTKKKKVKQFYHYDRSM